MGIVGNKFTISEKTSLALGNCKDFMSFTGCYEFLMEYLI